MPKTGITKKEALTFQELFRKSYTYLNDNFHKFDQRNKIQVALAVCKMAVPQKLEHSGGVEVTMPTIQKEFGEASLERMEFNIGTLNPSEDLRHPREDISAN